jgi:hypothetical protein
VNSANNELAIKKKGIHDIDDHGHIEIVQGHLLAKTWAMNAELLTEEETLGD